MQNSASQLTEAQRVFPGSDPNRQWPQIQVKRIQHPAGEGTSCFQDAHTLWMSLAPRPVRLLHTQAGTTQTGLYAKGDMVITPAKTSLCARWDSDDQLVQVQLNSQFLQTVARETLPETSDRLELFPAFRVRDPQLEAIAMMLLTELHQEQYSQLYIDSLANIFAVQLLRQHTTTQLQVPSYAGGLPQHQLMQVLDYVDAHLDRDLKLADLACLLKMSQFHFSRLFKQSIGLSPHQYLLQQRLERVKQLLKQKDRPILDIALACGFNSHSHLSKQFRQATGMTPKAYRAS